MTLAWWSSRSRRLTAVAYNGIHDFADRAYSEDAIWHFSQRWICMEELSDWIICAPTNPVRQMQLSDTDSAIYANSH
jgi:hypothetical protein